jgi:hypothetical protein
MTELYIYLNQPEHVSAWVDGGSVPINPASFYRSDARGGVMTPDENHILRVTGIDPEAFVAGPSLPPMIAFEDPLGAIPPASRSRMYSIEISNVRVSRRGAPTRRLNGRIETGMMDGLILSMTTVLSAGLARRFGGKKAAVRIRDLRILIETLDDQIRVKCKAGRVAYTGRPDRNHFLKSRADNWQAEYRLLWLTDDVKQRWVELPPGIATEVGF